MATSEAELKTLIVSGLDGDATAHCALLHALVPLLHAFYRRRVASVEDVEDLVQDTLIAVHTRRETFDRHRAFTPWLYSIARYRMIDSFRRRKQTVPIEGVEDILVTEGFETAVNARMDIDRLLETLPPKQARAIRDTHVDGRSVVEAAVGAGIGESDVKVSVHRGLKVLAARIKRS